MVVHAIEQAQSFQMPTIDTDIASSGPHNPRIVFHIGLHKTATTSLQVDTFPHLSEVNYFSLLEPAAGRYVNDVIAIDPIYYPDSHRQAANELHEKLDDTRCNLLSSEALSGPAWVGVMQRGIDHRLPVLMNLAHDFPNAEMILILRRQDTYAKSMYRQYIKTGGTESMQRFLGKSKIPQSPLFSTDRFYYMPFVRHLKTLFPRVHVLIYEQLLEAPDDFMDKLTKILNLKNPVQAPGKRNSTKIGSTGLRICRVLNRLFRSPLNPGGLIPGLPFYSRGRFKLVNPVNLLQDHWPGSNPKQSDAEMALCAELLHNCREDNLALQELLDEDLGRYGYC